jgi:dihydroneopterin aldolase
MDRISVEGLEVDCIVGVRPPERRRRQLVRIDLDLGMDLSEAGKSGRIADTADYSRIADEVQSLLRFREYQLIEVATEELAAMLFGSHGNLHEVGIRLEKPEALRGRARSASVRIERTRHQFPTRVRAHACGAHELLLHTHEARLELFRIEPQRTATLEPGHGARRLEWNVGGQLTLEGRLLEREPVAFPAGQPGSYHNPGNEMATLFRCECSSPLALPGPSA